MSSRAVEVEDDYDDHQAEFLEVYEGTPDPVRSVCIINHVTSENSPVLPLYKGNKVYKIRVEENILLHMH